MSVDPANHHWTQYDIDQLSYLWQTHSAGAIGAILMKTRNAVIGKAHRLGLSPKGQGRPRIHIGRSASRSRLEPKKLQKSVPVVVTEPVFAPVPGGVHIMDLAYEHCRAVIGHGEDGLARYCGAQRSQRARTHMGQPVMDLNGESLYEISSYCSHHSALYYRE